MAITLVTGGGRGIGAATCLRLAAAGHDVAVGYQHDEQAAARVAAAVAATGRRALAVRADIADGTQVREMFDRVEAELGTPTGLVNNAGVASTIGPFTELSEADLRRVVDVNVIGYILCAQQAARRMRPGGAIVNVSSVAATLGSPGEYVHYAAAKAAVETLTVGLSKELGPAGIRVNTVSPGVIDTEFHAGSGEARRADRVGPAAPLGRAGRPDEVAAAIAWLLTDEASYVTGATLKVSGGR
ncbi:oxidoreductase [Catellatospora sp. TT07R-123]|uniref:SDR family oxidoreductase n=1 Tax=Catellatospora sp. TT07R-123 TaxID=2733863 RepID=UPI001B155E8B|nr:SDR family oxidoreductase [Catellatospora sp. TT07R-123]GHJ44425.1 oxidoreductase [Catellatospora sp. TT07R-123]